MKDILQFAIDVEEDGDDMEKKIMKILEDADISVMGIAWKARWTGNGYLHCETPISSD